MNILTKSLLTFTLSTFSLALSAQDGTIATSESKSQAEFIFTDDAKSDMIMQDANQSMMDGDYKAAIATVDEILKENPGTVSALVLRSRARAAMSDTAGAFHDLREIIKYNPNKPDGYIYLSIGYMRVKSYREALKWANQGLEKDPENPHAYMQRGEVKYLMGDKKAACLDWSKAGDYGYLHAFDVIFEKCTNVSMVR